MRSNRFTVRPTRAGRVVGIGLGRVAYIGGAVALMLTGHAHAGPEGASVKAGEATFSKSGNTTVIHASDNAIIDYTRFGIGAGETVRFVQPGAAARVLNRVIGSEATKINGTLSANGIVYIANPAGIFFGDQAVVNVGGLVAAGANITNADFLNNVDRFTGVSGDVSNLGSITAADDGAIHLVGAQVGNHGVIVAERGLVTMSSGDDVYLGTRGGHTFVQITNQPGPAQAGAAIENTGTVRAGAAMMVAGDLFSIAASHSGHIEASDIAIEGRSGDASVVVSGTLDASSDTGHGGSVRLLADRVGVTGNAIIDASGATGGGSVRVGGDLQGQGALQTATRTYVGPNTAIHADALVSGDAGDVIVWSDEVTRFSGTINARAADGAGGFAEVSGKESLEFTGGVDLSGTTANGTLLLDPENILVDDFGGAGEVADLTEVDMFADAVGGTTSDLDVGLINNATANVIVQATDSITFNAAVTMVNADVGIAADAGNSITVNSPITTSGGDVLLTANSQLPGSMSMGGGSISVNAPISTGTGVITLDAAGAGAGVVNLGADLTTDGAAVTINSAAVSLAADLAISTGNAAAGDVRFDGPGTPTLDGAQMLAVDAGTGTVAFGAVGQSTALTGLTVVAGAAELGGSIALDNAPLDLRTDVGAISLLADSTIDAGGANTVSLASTTGDFDLAITGGDIALGTTVTNSLSLTGGALTLNGPVLSDTALDFSGVDGIAVTGPVSIFAGVAGAPEDITFDAGNTITGAFQLAITGSTVTLFRVGDGADDPTQLTISGDSILLNDTLSASERVTLSPNTGDVGLNDAAGGLQISLADLALLEAPAVTIGAGGAETINVASMGVVDLSGLVYDLTLQGVAVLFNTSANDGVVMGMDRVLRLTASSIERADGAPTLDVRTSGTGGVSIIAAGTVGGANRIQTDINALAGVVTGGLFLDNVSPLDLGTVGGVVGLTTETEIDVTATGALDVTAFVGGTGDSIITLSAIGGDAADVTVLGEIQGARGPVAINAENDITVIPSGLIRTIEGGSVTLTADTDMAGAGGAITMADGGVVRSDTGSIALLATNDIALSLLEITDGAAGGIAVTSTDGDILDANADATNIAVPGGGSGTVVLSAVNGTVGAGDAIELSVNGAATTGITDGDLSLIFDGDVAGQFSAADGDVSVTADGTVGTAGDWDGNAITIVADDLDITMPIEGRNSLAISRRTDGVIAIGNDATGAEAGEMRLARTEIELITTPDATVGGANTTALTVSGIDADESDQIDAMTLRSTGGVSFEAQPSAFEQLTVSADDGVSIATALASTGDMMIDGDADNAAATDDAIRIIENGMLESGGALTLAATSGGIDVDADNIGTTRVTAQDDLVVEDALTVRSALAMISAASSTLMAPATSIDGALLSVQGDTGVTVDRVTTDGSFVAESAFDTTGGGVTTITDAIVGNGPDATIELRGADLDIQGTVSATEGQVRLFRADAGDLTVGSAGIIDNTELSRIAADRLVISAINPGDVAVVVDGLDAGSLAGITGDILITAVQQGGQVRFEGAPSTAPTLDVRADDGVMIDADLTTTVGDLLVGGDDDGAPDGDDAIRIGEAAVASAGLLRLDAPSGGVILTGADGAAVSLTAQSIEAGQLAATNSPDLTINTGGSVSFDALEINDGRLVVAFDTDDDEAATGSFTNASAGAVEISAGADDTITLGTLDVGTGASPSLAARSPSPGTAQSPAAAPPSTTPGRSPSTTAWSLTSAVRSRSRAPDASRWAGPSAPTAPISGSDRRSTLSPTRRSRPVRAPATSPSSAASTDRPGSALVPEPVSSTSGSRSG